MATLFQKLNSVDNRVRDSVFGYVRSMEKLLCIHNIPALVSYITLNFYYHNEYFAKYGKQVKLTNNNMTITRHETLSSLMSYENTTYGNTWIDSIIPQIAKWTLKASVKKSFFVFMLSTDNRCDKTCNNRDDAPLYGLAKKIDNGWLPMYADKYGHNCHCNDKTELKALVNGQFSIILNTKNKTISFQNGDESQEMIIIYENIQIGHDIKYKLGINLITIQDKVSLIDFDLRLQ